jgi:uncharacterized protein (TIGR02453 family)
MLQPATLKFLGDLKKNNNKPWFDAHRKEYDSARSDFEKLIQNILDIHSEKDPDLKGLVAKQCMFRINRDVRFSKDKSPYKTNFGASMDRGGKKSIYAGYYFHLEPGSSFIGGGLWMPMPAELKKVRQEIDYCFDEFDKIVRNKKFTSVYNELYRGDDVSLTKVPHGFEKDSPAAAYLKLKSWLAMRNLSDAEVTSKNLVKQTVQSFKELMPFIKFINRAIEDV